MPEWLISFSFPFFENDLFWGASSRTTGSRVIVGSCRHLLWGHTPHATELHFINSTVNQHKHTSVLLFLQFVPLSAFSPPPPSRRFSSPPSSCPSRPWRSKVEKKEAPQGLRSWLALEVFPGELFSFGTRWWKAPPFNSLFRRKMKSKMAISFFEVQVKSNWTSPQKEIPSEIPVFNLCFLFFVLIRLLSFPLSSLLSHSPTLFHCRGLSVAILMATTYFSERRWRNMKQDVNCHNFLHFRFLHAVIYLFVIHSA